MGATAVRQMAQILTHVETIVAIELFAAAQGIDLRRQDMGQPGAKLGQGSAAAYDLIRQHIPYLEHDTTLAPHIEQVRQLVANGTIKQAIEAAVDG